MTIITNNFEVDEALIPPPPSPSALSSSYAPLQGYLKLVKATQKGERLKQGCEVTPGIEQGTLRTEGCALSNCATLAPINVELFWMNIKTINAFGFRMIWWTVQFSEDVRKLKRQRFWATDVNRIFLHHWGVVWLKLSGKSSL